MILLKSQEKCIMELAFIEKKANLSSVEIYEQNNLSLKKIQFLGNRNIYLNVFDDFYYNFFFLPNNTVVYGDYQYYMTTSELIEYYIIL